MEEEEGELEDGVLDKGTSDRVWKRSNLVYSKSGACAWTFDFCLSTSIPVLTTSTYVVAWPQGDQFLGGDL